MLLNKGCGLIGTLALILVCVFLVVPAMQEAGQQSQVTRNNNWNNGPTIFEDGTGRKVQGQSQTVQDMIARTQVAQSVCAENNNCSAPVGTIALDGMGLLIFALIVAVVVLLIVWQLLKAFLGGS